MKNNVLEVHFEITLKLDDFVEIETEEDCLPTERAEVEMRKKLEKIFGEKAKSMTCYPYLVEGKIKGKHVKYCKDYGSRGEPYFYDALKES